MNRSKFEQIMNATSVKELIDIVSTPEEMLTYFEKGTKLVADCNKVLDETEAKLNILVKKEGEINE